MKPFNLEAAKAGAKVITRIGQPARILCFDLVSDYPIVAAVFNGDYIETVVTHTNNGNTCIGSTCERDLFMAPAKTGAWINIYPLPCHTNRFYASYHTKEEADKNTTHDRIACIYVEWEE